MTDTLLILLAVSALIGVVTYLFLRGAQEPPPIHPIAPAPPPVPAKPYVVTKIREVLPTKIAQQLEAIEQQLRKPAPPAPVPPPPPAPVPSPAPPRVAAPGTPVRIQLVSAKGRHLGQPIAIDARARRPVYRHRTNDGQVSVFVADHQDLGGVWVYRRVGVEREA